MSLCGLLSSFSPSGKMVALQRSDETKSTALDLIRGYPNLVWHRLLPLRCDSLGAGGTTLASTRLLIRSSCRDAKAQLVQEKVLILFPPLFNDRCKPDFQPAFTLYRDTAHLMPDPHRATFVRNNSQGLMQANSSNGAYRGRQAIPHRLGAKAGLAARSFVAVCNESWPASIHSSQQDGRAIP